MFLFHNLITLVLKTSCWLKQYPYWAISPLLRTPVGGGKPIDSSALGKKVGMATPCLTTACTLLKVLLLIYSTVDFILGGSNCLLG